MPPIDIPVSVDLQRALDLPPCDALRLPMPEPLQLRLPTGGSINALSDLSKGVPTDCSLTFSLMVQLSPFLAALDCPLKMLKLLKPLAEIVGGLAEVPPSPPSPELIAEMVQAVADLTPCFAVLTGAPLIPFICDLLNLISKVLKCLIGQLKTVVALASGLSVQLAAAADNPDLLAQLECAQENADAAAKNLTQAIEPVSVILELASPLFELAGIESITLAPPGGEAAADSLAPTIQTLEDVVQAIDDVRGAICP